MEEELKLGLFLVFARVEEERSLLVVAELGLVVLVDWREVESSAAEPTEDASRSFSREYGRVVVFPEEREMVFGAAELERAILERE